nr:Pyrimidine deaminase [Streptococcus thermophilus]
MLDTIIGPTSAREEIRAVVITTVFGSFTTGGTSEELGNDTDSQVLVALRDWADVILVGSGTVKAEDYGPSDTQMAVVSRSLDFDTSAKLFGGTPPLILTPEASLTDAALADRRRRLTGAGCSLIGTGEGGAGEIVDKLRELGYGRIICEGGPSLYADMLAHSLIDVLHLTIDPRANGEPAGLQGDFTVNLELEEVQTDGSFLFARYRRV